MVGLKGFLGKGFPKGASFQQETSVKYSAGSSCVYHLALSCAYHIFWLKNFSNTFLDSTCWRMLSKRPAVPPPEDEPPAEGFRKEMVGLFLRNHIAARKAASVCHKASKAKGQGVEDLAAMGANPQEACQAQRCFEEVAEEQTLALLVLLPM